MRDLAPDIARERLLVEGFYTTRLDAAGVATFLKHLASGLEMAVYAEPIVYSPRPDAGRPENQGYDAFVPLIDSGISMYAWTSRAFFSLVVYTCESFDSKQAVALTRENLGVRSNMEWKKF